MKYFYNKRRKLQKGILDRLKNDEATSLDYFFADNVTRANYADFSWPDKSITFRWHFMFHTHKRFNGFSTGKKPTQDHYVPGHCCYCSRCSFTDEELKYMEEMGSGVF